MFDVENLSGWKKSVQDWMGESRYRAWFYFAEITERPDRVSIGLPGPWCVGWMRDNYLGKIRAAVAKQYPKADVHLYVDSLSRSTFQEFANRKRDKWSD